MDLLVWQVVLFCVAVLVVWGCSRQDGAPEPHALPAGAQGTAGPSHNSGLNPGGSRAERRTQSVKRKVKPPRALSEAESLVQRRLGLEDEDVVTLVLSEGANRSRRRPWKSPEADSRRAELLRVLETREIEAASLRMLVNTAHFVLIFMVRSSHASRSGRRRRQLRSSSFPAGPQRSRTKSMRGEYASD
eukprot:scaffold570_cov234-Pinguiococcus_pyrenoidosus.AAC.10